MIHSLPTRASRFACRRLVVVAFLVGLTISLHPAPVAAAEPDHGASLALTPALVEPQPAAFMPSGAVRDWGYNGTGQIGDNTNTTRTSPAAPSNANGFLNTGITAVGAGYGHSLAVRNGAVYAWGFGIYGQLGNNGASSSNVPVATVGLTSGVTGVTAGYGHSLAVKNGAAYAWGYNADGQLGVNSTDGKFAPTAVNGLATGVTAIAAGYYHSLAVQNGGVFAWGDNTYFQLGNDAMPQSNVPVAVAGLATGVTAIATGFGHGLAIQNGGLYAWGYNYSGQLGNNTTASGALAAAVPGLSTGVTAIAAGSSCSLAVQNGHVYAWGDNHYGELGNGTGLDSHAPVEVPYGAGYLSNIVAVAAGNASCYALASDGSLYVWGHNDRGDLGLGTTADSPTPQHLLPPSGLYYQFIESDGDGEHALAILGSSPPADSLVVPALAVAPNGTAGAYSFSFPTQAGTSYQLQRSGDLSAWTNVVGQSATGDGTVKTLSDTGSAGSAFWRLSVAR